MNKLIIAMAALAIASPAFANDFTGPRAELQLGYDAGYSQGFDADGFGYGMEFGYDTALSDSVTLGALAGINWSTASQLNGAVNAGTDVELGLQMGFVVMPKVLITGRVSYANTGVSINTTAGSLTAGLEGARFGVGTQINLTKSIYTSIGYTYTTYGDGDSRDVVKAGFGYRF